MNMDQLFREHDRYMQRLAVAYYRRLRVMPMGIEVEDIRAEINVAFVHAARAWSPEGGASFTTFLARGAWFHVQRWVNNQKRQLADKGVSLSRPLGEEGEATVGDMLPSDAPSPEEIVRESQLHDRMTAVLSPLARRFLSLLTDPPDELREEMMALMAQAEWARSLGIVVPAPTRVTFAMISRLMGLSRARASACIAEIEAMSAEVSR
jgi:DNA-directed RNA polymerase specialized sigma24 family protein